MTARLLITCVGVAVALGSGCQILGIAPIPCTEDAQCPAPLVCGGEDVCVTPPVTPTPLPIVPEEGPLRTVDDGCSFPSTSAAAETVSITLVPSAGSTALNDAPAFSDVDAEYVVAPGSCPRGEDTTPCNFVGDEQAVLIAQPVSARAGQNPEDVRLRMFRDARALTSPGVEELNSGFVVEAVFQVPPPVVDGRLVFGQVDSWGLYVSGDTAYFFAGGVFIPVGSATTQPWVHLLCFVDGADVARAAPDQAVFCAVDGAPAGGASAPSGRSGLIGGDLVFDDVALASLRIWIGPELPDDLFARNDLLSERARRRLLAFAGVAVEGDVRAVAYSNIFANSDAKLFPLFNLDGVAAAQGFVRVGLRWPRVVPAAGRPAGRALLLEPARANLFENPALRSLCDGGIPASEPVALPLAAACDPVDVVVLAATPPSADAEDNTETFSLFADPVGAAPSLDVELQLSNGAVVSCDLLAGTRLCGDGTPFRALETAGAFSRTSVTVDPPAGVVVSEVRILSSNVIVWAPQLEHGATATLPIEPGPPSEEDGSANRPADELVLEGGALGAATQLVQRATVSRIAAAGSEVAFVLTDGYASSSSSFAALSFAREGANLLVAASAGNGAQELNSIPLPAGPVTVGASFGGGASCDGCDVEAHTDDLTTFDVQLLSLSSTAEPFLLHDAQLETNAGGLLVPRALRIGVEPRVVGCALTGDAAFFDASDEGCRDGYCARDGRVWAGAPERVLGPNVGDLGFDAAAAEAVSGHDVDEDLFIEARFRVDRDGDALVLLDEDGARRFSIGAAGGTVDIRVADATGTLTAGRDAWVHVTCWIGAGSTGCFRNLGILNDSGAENSRGVVRLDAGLDGALVRRVELPGEVGPLMVARGFALPVQPGSPDEQRELGLFLGAERALRAFGLHAAARRDPAVASMLRDERQHVERVVNGARVPFLVSGGWAHVVLDDGPALSLEPALDDVLPDDLGSWQGGAALEGAAGPSGLAGAALPDGQSISFASALGGPVSVYARATQGAPALTLDVGGARRTVDLKEPLFDSNVIDAGDDWVRVFVSSSEGDGAVTLSVSGGDIVVAAPQLDAGGSLTAPAFQDRRGHDRLMFFGSDLNLGPHASTINLDVSAEGDGIFATLLAVLNLSADPTDIIQAGFAVGLGSGGVIAENVTFDAELRRTSLGDLREFAVLCPALDLQQVLHVSLRDFALVARTGQRVNSGSMFPFLARASRLVLGNLEDDHALHARIRSFTVSDELQ